MRFKLKSILYSWGLSFLVLMLIVVIIEFSLGFWTRQPFTSSLDKRLYEGNDLTADIIATQTFNFGDDTHTATYTLTKDRYRYTPVSNPLLRDKFIALFGCSFIFGTTVNDNEPIPAYIGETKTDYMPYNFGKPGLALQHAYSHLLHRNLKQEIAQEQGVLVYLYMGFQVRRIIGGVHSPSHIADATYIALETGQLIDKGTFREHSPWGWSFYDWLHNRKLYKRFGSILPINTLQPRHWDLVATLFVESANLFHASFPDSRFVIAFWAEPSDMAEITSRIRAKAAPIEIIDLQQLIETQGVVLTYFPDSHLRPESNRKVAEILVDSLFE